MKRLLMLISLSLWIDLSYSEDYKVLFVNDANLKYSNGKAVKKGDVISDVNSIKWELEKQAVKVISQVTKKIALFTGKEWVRAKGTEALVYTKHTSTQVTDNSDDIYTKLFSIFDNEYELMDSIEITTDIELSDVCYFTAAYMYGDAKIVKKLGHKDNHIIIDMSLFHVDDKNLEPRDVQLSIEYVNEKEFRTISVRDEIDLLIIPKMIK